MDRKARIAVMGAGLMGRRHIEHVSREAELLAVVDPAEAAEGIAAQHAVPCVPTLAALLDTARPDGVIVATPNQVHVEHGFACIAARIPALIEKPLSDDIASAERLVSEAQAQGVPLLVGHHRRHNPLVRHARSVIDDGRIGRLVAVHATCWLYKPDDYFDHAWRRQPGAGPLLINLTHDIDLLRYLCGEVAAVQAMAANAIRGHAVEDTAAILLRFRNGAIGTATLSDTVVAPWSWELTASENPVYPVTGEACYRIGGTDGALSLPDLGLWRQAGVKSWWEPVSRASVSGERGDPFALQVRHFADVALGRAEPLVPASEGLATLRVMTAIGESVRRGTVIELA